MYSTNYSVALVLALFAALSHGKVVNLKNARSTPLDVSVGDSQYTVAGKGFVPLQLADEWSGVISAVPAPNDVPNVPRTQVHLHLSSSGDTYAVSLVDGYNLRAKVIPNGSVAQCGVAVCTADSILNVCPVGKQVTNSLDEVVACHNDPLLMSLRCPLAVVDIASPINVLTCPDALSYLVVFG